MIGESGDIMLKSIVITICVLWFSVDVAIWLSRKTWSMSWKLVTFCAATNLALILNMWAMLWLLELHLTEKQENVFHNLSASAFMPPSKNLFESVFTVRNLGSADIGKHQISCAVNLITGGRFTWEEGGALIKWRETFPLRRGGGAQSDRCLIHTIGGVKPRCGDITVEIEYSLEIQPEVTKTKQFRFVADEVDDYAWHEQSVDVPGTFCEGFRHKFRRPE